MPTVKQMAAKPNAFSAMLKISLERNFAHFLLVSRTGVRKCTKGRETANMRCFLTTMKTNATLKRRFPLSSNPFLNWGKNAFILAALCCAFRLRRGKGKDGVHMNGVQGPILSIVPVLMQLPYSPGVRDEIYPHFEEAAV